MNSCATRSLLDRKVSFPVVVSRATIAAITAFKCRGEKQTERITQKGPNSASVFVGTFYYRAWCIIHTFSLAAAFVSESIQSWDLRLSMKDFRRRDVMSFT